MGPLLAAPWLAVVVPLVLALLLALFGRFLPRSAPWFAMLGPLLVIALGAVSLLAIPSGSHGVAPWTSATASLGGITWFRVGVLSLTLSWAVDSLAAVMLLVVGVVALMVMVFSIGYMHGDRGWVRYFALLSVFTGSMTLLVIGGSFVSLFLGWELVGACSYLLIGFWFEKPTAAAAAVKAFLTTRVGDVGLLMGLAVLWATTRSLSYVPVMARLGSVAPSLVTAAAVLLAIGAIGKSAQFPLHIWLPDAMEGPTPVSALIHAATMVAAGVFLVARTWPIFESAPAARTLLLSVGVISALGASLAAFPQRDIKKVLAYSTISQLGFMFCALGVGAWAVAFFHLVTHAAFKALLFLTSGSVIHGADTQDLHEMGGLRKWMPVTATVWIIGVGALVGVIPLSGFFSKDLILDVVWAATPLAGALLFVTAFVTGLYSGRTTRLAFFGAPRGEKRPHESPLSMLVPLVVLAVPAALLGFASSWLFTTLGQEPEHLSVPISVLAVGLGLAGAAVGWVLAPDAEADMALERRGGALWGAARAAFGWDALVGAAIIRPTVAFCRLVWAVVDRYLIDGIVEGSGRAAGWLGRQLSRLQTGDAQSYSASLAGGIVFLLAIAIFAYAATVWAGR